MPHTLSRRAVACGGWRWLRGMLRQDDYRYIGSGMWARWSDVHSLTTALHAPDQLPDLTDSATRGCLLTLVREAWGNPHIWVESCVDREMWSSIDHYKLGWACPNGEPVPPDIECATEAEALVAALEAAP